MGIYKGIMEGKIIIERQAVGTLSEGPVYYLIPTGKYMRWKKILLRKKVDMWEKDPVLHNIVGQNVSILGEIIETKNTITLDYIEISKQE